MLPAFPQDYLVALLNQTDSSRLPLEGKSVSDLAVLLTPILFDPNVDAKTTNLDANADTIVTSAKVEAFYADMAKKTGNPRLSYGLNSQLAKTNGKPVERVWKVGGMYSP